MTERRGSEPPRGRGGDPERSNPPGKASSRRPPATDSTRSAAQRPADRDARPRKAAPRNAET
ncbi:MAG TPA: hypothetical protein VGD34_21730, partial [Kribbella sp.]